MKARLSPLVGSHRRTVLSELTETRSRPSGENATSFTRFSCPARVRELCLERFQRRIVLSKLAEANHWESGEDPIASTAAPCPARTSLRPVPSCKTLMALSSATQATHSLLDAKRITRTLPRAPEKL